jgi:peptide/nickel transport system permease protein
MVSVTHPDGRTQRRPRRFRGVVTALRTILVILASLVGLAAVTFTIGRFLPTDPVLAAIGDHASAELYAQTRLDMGLDRPIALQFLTYLTKLLHGDLGQSLLTGQSVLKDLASFFPATFELSTAALLFGLLIGIPLGVTAAANQGRPLDHLIRVVSLTGYSVPVFWFGLVGLVVLYVKLGLVPGPGRIDVAYEYAIEPTTGLILIDTLLAGNLDAFWDALAHLLLPAAILGYYSAAYIARMTRAFMIDALHHEFISTARIKGMPEQTVLWLHALPSIAGPLITVIGLAYASLLEGAVLTETVFAWPGLGLYITNALFNADLNAVLGGTLVVGTAFLLLNMATDGLQRYLDPRVTRS